MATKDLILELGSEEIPASFVVPALADMENSLAASLSEARLSTGAMRAYGTPRRLTIIIKDVAEQQADMTEEVVGPPSKVAFNADGTLTPVGANFAKGKGLDPSQVSKKQTEKGEYLYAQKFVKGGRALEVLPALLTKAITDIKFKKSMRWGHQDVTFARPLHWIVALFGEEVVPVSHGDVKSGRTTFGHRFLSPEPITLRSPHDYAQVMEKAHVNADVAKRRHDVEHAAQAAARSVNGFLLKDEALLDTVTNLVEWPSAVLGDFDARYLDLPPEVLISEMKSHQKYFSVVDAAGKLMPHFVAISNTPVKDPKVSKRGYETVLLSRLADARFFFDEDQKRKLQERVEDLKRVVFQQQLGSSYEKMERFRTLALELAKSTGKGDAATVERAATLCKADLVTGMVGEFPELQGIVGREYARKQNEGDAVAVAIDEHYMPRNAGDKVPAGDAGALIGIADRLDSVVGLIGIGKKPSGATDPFGIRRQTLAIINIILEKGYRLNLGDAIDRSLALLNNKVNDPKKTRAEVLDYFRDRLKNLWTEAHRADVVEAVLSAGFGDLVAAAERVSALSGIVGQAGFEPLAIAFKRVVNIVQKQASAVPGGEVDSALFQDDAERALFKAFHGARAKVDESIKSNDFAGALKEITGLKPAVDTFFDKVLVMAEDARVRDNRVRLLREIGAMFGRIADFSQIQAGEKA
ncbi:MAG: glycine--tRNA ligase subunit beta [Deltaproteobacteria bacterium]|nr:glycine--tRNA ligase subunit beta [Deltaproteobacteria bacterium]